MYTVFHNAIEKWTATVPNGLDWHRTQWQTLGLMVEKSLICLTPLYPDTSVAIHILLNEKQMCRLFVFIFLPSRLSEKKALFCCVTGSCSINFLCPQNTQLKALLVFTWHKSDSTQTPRSTLSIPPQLSLFIFSVKAKQGQCHKFVA